MTDSIAEALKIATEAQQAMIVREPEMVLSEDDSFLDGLMVKRLSKTALADYVWSPGLGWMTWTGTIWERIHDAGTIEAVRAHIATEYTRVQKEVEKYQALAAAGDESVFPALQRTLKTKHNWGRYLSAGKLQAVVSLGRGAFRVEDKAFDKNPDVLNVANGVVDLRTGELTPHDRKAYMTKIAPTDYVPGATHPDWDQALEALPDDVREWFQVRCGQAITGYPSPDDRMVVQHGGGENGKTTIVSAISRALGDYYVYVSHRALLGDPSQHSTEQMVFRGARMAVVEETPEERRLSVTRLKDTVGKEEMEARYMRQDATKWKSTHTLFLNTNYIPSIEETDHGTWRRLALLTFPYTFVSGGGSLTRYQRRGDPTLRERLQEGGDGRTEAVLAWLVAGARKWYAAGKVMPPLPERVARDTFGWRSRNDLILAYLSERIVFDNKSHIICTDLRDDFNAWAIKRGNQELGERTFSPRFGSHEIVMAHDVKQLNMRPRPGLSTRPGRAKGQKPPERYRAWVGVRFRVDGDPPMRLSPFEPDDDPAPEPDDRAPEEGGEPDDPTPEPENWEPEEDDWDFTPEVDEPPEAADPEPESPAKRPVNKKPSASADAVEVLAGLLAPAGDGKGKVDKPVPVPRPDFDTLEQVDIR